MIVRWGSTLYLAMALFGSACSLAQESPDPTPRPELMTVSPASLATDRPTAWPAGAAEPPPEAIMVLEPQAGSRLTSPLHIVGIADPTFEQTLVARLVLDDGTELALVPLMIQAPLGERGPFEGDLEFSVNAERIAQLQVYVQSARDGGITHLASAGVTLAPEGPADVNSVGPLPEWLQITRPIRGDRISGGAVQVQGVGVAGFFGGALMIEVYDVDGNLIGSEPASVDAAGPGLPGEFDLEVPYQVAAEGPGRIVVLAPQPIFNGISHLSSVEVRLAP